MMSAFLFIKRSCHTIWQALSATLLILFRECVEGRLYKITYRLLCSPVNFTCLPRPQTMLDFTHPILCSFQYQYTSCVHGILRIWHVCVPGRTHADLMFNVLP